MKITLLILSLFLCGCMTQSVNIQQYQSPEERQMRLKKLSKEWQSRFPEQHLQDFQDVYGDIK